MKKATYFLVSFFFLNVNVFDAWGQNLPRCQTLINPKIEFYSTFGKLEYDFTKNTQEITALTDTPAAGLATTRLGHARTLSFHLNRFGRGYCVSAKEIKVYIGISKPVIYVTKDYLEGSCFQKVVIRHEDAHMQTTIRMLDHFMKNAPKLYTYMIRHIQPIYAKDQSEIDNAGKVLTKEYDFVMEGMTKELQREIDVEQEKLDNETQKYLRTEICWEHMKYYKQYSEDL
ncbi:MAG: hypothetical protein ACK5N8_03415 [Alphaproteobacteria bacterium]